MGVGHGACCPAPHPRPLAQATFPPFLTSPLCTALLVRTLYRSVPSCSGAIHDRYTLVWASGRWQPQQLPAWGRGTGPAGQPRSLSPRRSQPTALLARQVVESSGRGMGNPPSRGHTGCSVPPIQWSPRRFTPSLPLLHPSPLWGPPSHFQPIYQYSISLLYFRYKICEISTQVKVPIIITLIRIPESPFIWTVQVFYM